MRSHTSVYHPPPGSPRTCRQNFLLFLIFSYLQCSHSFQTYLNTSLNLFSVFKTVFIHITPPLTDFLMFLNFLHQLRDISCPPFLFFISVQIPPCLSLREIINMRNTYVSNKRFINFQLKNYHYFGVK